MKKRILSIIATFILLIICMLLSTEVMAVTFPDNCPEIKVGETKSHSLSMWSSDVFYKFVPTETGFYKIVMSTSGQVIVWTPDGKQQQAVVDDYWDEYHKFEKGKTYYLEMYSNSTSSKSISMKVETANFIQLTDSVVTTLTMTPSSTQGQFEFIPEKDGLYRFDISIPDTTSDAGVTIYAEPTHIDYTNARYNKHHFASLYVLKKGVSYYGDFSCYGMTEDTVVNIIAKPEPISALSLSNTHHGSIKHAEDLVVMSFTPPADGIYKPVYSANAVLAHYDSNFKKIYGFNGGYSVYGYEPRFMEAGKTYYYLFDFSSANPENYSITIQKAIPENLNLTNSTEIKTLPKEIKFYKFIPTYDGIYNFTIGSTICENKSSSSTVVLYDENFNLIVSSTSYVEKKLDAGKTYYYTVHPGYYGKENTITYSFMGEQIVPISENTDIKAEITTAGKFKYYKFTPSYTNGAIYDVSFSGTSTPKVEVCNKNLEASFSKTANFCFEQATKEDDYTILKVGFSDSQKTGTVNLSLVCHELIHLENGKEYTTNITKAGDYRYFYYNGYSDNDDILVFDAYGDFTSSIVMTYSPGGHVYSNTVSEGITTLKPNYFKVTPTSESSKGELKVKVSSSPFYTVYESFYPTTIEIKNPGDCAWVSPDIYYSYPDEIFSIISEGDCDTYIDAYKYGVSNLEYAGNDDNSGEGNNFSFDMTDIAFCRVKLKDDATGKFTVRLSATSNKTITLGAKNTITCTVHGDDKMNYSSFTYTPTTTGMYKFNTLDNPENMISTTCEVFDSNGKGITYSGFEDYFLIYLEANKEYLFRCHAYSDTSGASSWFKLSKAADKNLGELPLDEKQNLSLPSGTIGYYTYTAKADETLYLISDNVDSGCIGHLDVFASDWRYINGQCHQKTSLKAGEEYIIYCCEDIYAKIMGTADNTTITTSNTDDLKSGYYENNMDKTWIYNAPEGTLYNEITFDFKTLFEDNDYLYIFDADEKEVGKYTSSTLQGKTIVLKGDKFKLRLVTNSSWINYGFSVSDVKNVDVVPVPAPNIPSGTIKPSSISLSAINIADIYYKIDTESNNGEYIKYTEPFEIIEDCNLTVYAQINGVKSESITYQYTIDTTPIAAPVITATTQSLGYVSISASAAEGKIYYRYIGTSKVYEYKSSLVLYSSNVVEFYAQLGNVKSKSVLYKCEVNRKDETYIIKKPSIITSPILGGYEVTVALPDGVTLCNKEDIVNYTDEHPQEMCGEYYGYEHNWGAWKYNFDITGLSLSVRKISGISDGETYYDSKELPKKYTITETASVQAQIHRYYENSSGNWSTYTEPGGTNIHTTGKQYAENSEMSEENFVFLEIPKADKPLITTALDKLYLYSNDGVQIYYSINDSEPALFSKPVPINSGDTIKAYAIDYGVAKSDIAEYTYIGESYTSSAMAYDILNTEVGFCMSNSGILSGSLDLLSIENIPTNANILLVAYDKETNQFVTMSKTPVQPTSDITRLDNIQLSGLEGKNVYVKAFVWEDTENIKPLSIAKTVYVSPKATVSANEDISVVTISSPNKISGEVIIALYDTFDRVVEIDIKPASSVVYPDITKTKNADYAKIMWWDMDTMKPMCVPETKSLK